MQSTKRNLRKKTFQGAVLCVFVHVLTRCSLDARCSVISNTRSDGDTMMGFVFESQVLVEVRRQNNALHKEGHDGDCPRSSSVLFYFLMPL